MAATYGRWSVSINNSPGSAVPASLVSLYRCFVCCVFGLRVFPRIVWTWRQVECLPCESGLVWSLSRTLREYCLALKNCFSIVRQVDYSTELFRVLCVFGLVQTELRERFAVTNCFIIVQQAITAAKLLFLACRPVLPHSFCDLLAL